MDKILPEFVINFDQTVLNYVPISHWTMDKEEVKRVEGVKSMEVVAKEAFHCMSFLLYGM